MSNEFYGFGDKDFDTTARDWFADNYGGLVYQIRPDGEKDYLFGKEVLVEMLDAYADHRQSGEVGALKGHPAIGEILSERVRQVEKEGWSPEHDDEHDNGEMALAAACYAAAPIEIFDKLQGAFTPVWPWDEKWDKRKIHDERRRLVIAGALIVAELERIDRALKSGEVGK